MYWDRMVCGVGVGVGDGEGYGLWGRVLFCVCGFVCGFVFICIWLRFWLWGLVVVLL